MNAADQLAMFEPESAALAQLVARHQRNAEFEIRRASNLEAAGYSASARASILAASELLELAAICESALLFEHLAGLQ